MHHLQKSKNDSSDSRPKSFQTTGADKSDVSNAAVIVGVQSKEQWRGCSG